jgi:hypothetical protein
VLDRRRKRIIQKRE